PNKVILEKTAFESSKICTMVDDNKSRNIFRSTRRVKAKFLVLATAYFANYQQNASQNSNLTLSK
ncbi:MAG: hypothetical protein KA773_22215, partial [Chloroflexi bacterium]|nr:hypothetical protein [Chloroflexota bacterium]